MPISTSNIVFAAISFAVGGCAFVKTQAIAGDWFEPILKECTSNDYATVDDFVAQTGYHAYNQYVSLVFFLNPFICAITQFVHALAETYPGGLLNWGVTSVATLPFVVLLNLEAGRQGSRGLIRYPVLVGILYQLLGICVVVPAIWVPAYCLGGNPAGSVSIARSKGSFLLIFTWIILPLLLFEILEDTQGYWWTLCAGIMAGPATPMTYLLLWFVGPPSDSITKPEATRNSEMVALSYGITGFISLLGWFYLMYVIMTTYNTDFEMVWKDVWAEAIPPVRFMAIDACVVWAGMVLHIGSRSFKGMVEAIVYTPFFGPGAACAMVLASLELENAPFVVPVTTSRDQQKKAS